MQLHTIMKLVKNNFMIDDELRVYIFKDRIEFIDFTPAIEQDGELLMDDFYGKLFTIYYRDNIIIAIEHNCLSMITSKNTGLYKFLADLINQEIEDLNTYPVLRDKYDDDCYQKL